MFCVCTKRSGKFHLHSLYFLFFDGVYIEGAGLLMKVKVHKPEERDLDVVR